MQKKLIAAGLIAFFSFILVTTAWDYCHPDADTFLYKGSPATQEHQIKKPHHPCASLKDAYDFLSLFKISQPLSAWHIIDIPIFTSAHFSFGADSFKRSGLSPPSESPPQILPLFQLNCNLRI